MPSNNNNAMNKKGFVLQQSLSIISRTLWNFPIQNKNAGGVVNIRRDNVDKNHNSWNQILKK